MESLPVGLGKVNATPLARWDLASFLKRYRNVAYWLIIAGLANRIKIAADENMMTGRNEVGVAKIAPKYTSHIPIPYGCMSLIAAIFAGIAAIALCLR